MGRWALENPSLVDWRKKGVWCCRAGCILPTHRVLPFAGLWLGTRHSTGSVGRSILLGVDGEQKLGCIAGQMVHRDVCSWVLLRGWGWSFRKASLPCGAGLVCHPAAHLSRGAYEVVGSFCEL